MIKLTTQKNYEKEFKDMINGVHEELDYPFDRYSCIINDINNPIMLYQYIYKYYNGIINNIKLIKERDLILSGDSLFDYLSSGYNEDSQNFEGIIQINFEDNDLDCFLKIDFEVYEPTQEEVEEIIIKNDVFEIMDMTYLLKILKIEILEDFHKED